MDLLACWMAHHLRGEDRQDMGVQELQLL